MPAGPRKWTWLCLGKFSIFSWMLWWSSESSGFESFINVKSARNHPVRQRSQEVKSSMSSYRACQEHVFVYMTMSMVWKLTRTIGLERNEAWCGLKNLTFNFLCFLPRSCHIAVVAWISGRISQSPRTLVICWYRLLRLCRLFGGFCLSAKTVQSDAYPRFT